jgi:tetratricopeptide (TPR) repeat protein
MWAAAILILLSLFATDFTTEGMKALEDRKYQEAADLFSKAIAVDPSDYAASFNLALSYSLMGKGAEAIPIYRKTLELKPGLHEAEINLGILLIGQKQAAEAIPYLQSAADADPKKFRPRSYLARAQLDAGDFAKAEQNFKLALESEPKSAAAEVGLAHAEARQNRLAEAAEHFQKASGLDPAYRDALLELGSLYEAKKQPSEAIAIYQQFPENMGAQERLGELLIEAKRYPEAIDCLEKVTLKDPTAANNLALGHAYSLNHEPEKAIARFEQAVAGDPDNYDLRMLYGRSLRDQKKFVPAANQFFAATQKKPDSQEAWNELVVMLVQLDDFPRALAALDRIKALGGEKPGHYFYRAIILDKTKQLKPALEAYQKFLASADGKFPDQEFQARQRARIIQRELSKR